MATYLQGVTDYIPDYQPFQPDLNFYNNVLQAKQTQYDSNWKAVNNLYAELHNADLTHAQNIQKKDDLLKQIDFNLKRVTGLDLSLQQNVDQATQVFRPFYEDKYLMKDMAWTKNYTNTVSRALNLKNSQDEKMRAQYWDTGIKDMQYRREEFKNATLDETLNMGNVSYTPYVNAMEKYLKIAKDAGLSIDIKDVDETGLYFIHEKNGKALTTPLQNLFLSAYANDPALQAVYSTQAYVKRKDYAEQNASKYNNNPVEAEKAYLKEQYRFLQDYTAKRHQKDQEKVNVTTNKVTSVSNDVSNSDANPYSESYLESLNKALGVDQTVANHSEKLNQDINGNQSSTIVTSAREGMVDGLDLTDMELARLRVDAGTASILAEQDVLGAADIYAYRDYKYEKSANPVGLENMRHQHSLARMDYAHTLKKQEIEYKASFDRETNRIKQGLEDGTIFYDQDGKMIEDDGSTFQFTLGTPSGQFTDEINVMKDNQNKYNTTVSNLTSDYIGNTLTTIKNLISGSKKELSEQEVWRAVSFLDPNSKEAKDKYGTGNGYQLFNKLWNNFQNDPEKFVLNFSKSGQVLKLKKFMDGWANTNYGHRLAVQYKSDKSGKSIEQFARYKEQMAIVDKTNHDKITKGLVGAMDNMGLKIKDETKVKIADLYIKQMKSGKDFDDDEFAAFVDKHLNYETPPESTFDKSLVGLLGKEKNSQYNVVVNNARKKWNSKEFWRSEEGQRIASSSKGIANAFQEYVDQQGLKFISQNISDTEFKKMLAKDVWKYNNALKKSSEEMTGSMLTSQQSAKTREQLNLAKQQLNQLKQTYRNDDRPIYGPNKSRLKEDIAKQEKTIAYLENQLKTATGKEKASYESKLKKSPYDYTPEELAAAKRKYIQDLDRRNKGYAELYSDTPYGRTGFSEKTGIDMDDLYSSLSKAYTKVVNQTGPAGLQSYAGMVKTAGGRFSLGSNDITGKKVLLSNPAWGGFKDFQEIMEDINRIKFSQDPSKYAVSIGGLSKTAAEKNAFSPAEAKAILRELQMSAGKKSKTPMFIIGRSPIAMENQDLAAMVIVPPQSFLEKHIKDSDGKTDWEKIKMIKKNGISFIAPKSQWTNSFYLQNETTPTQQILNAQGKIHYEHGNKAGEYTIEKVRNVPGVDYRMDFMGYRINIDGSITTEKNYLLLQKSGNKIDDSEAEIYDAIQKINEDNLETFKEMQRRGDTAAIKKVQQFFNTPTYMSYKY